jgi:predicted regulator of Ras-like GTPase activity (Roadblock/LC7/MglB family)
MNSDQLNGLVSAVEGVRAAAWCDSRGVVRGQSSGFDGDVPCAVATISSSQLSELGQLLGAGPLRDWTITTSTINVYVFQRGEAALVALGEADDKAPVIAEKMASAVE